MTPRKSRSPFDEFCRDALRFLNDANAPSLVIGGLAVVALGEPRITGDIDVIAYLSNDEARALVDQAIAAGFEADAAVEAERIRKTGTLCLRRGRWHLDVILASLPFEDRARERAVEKRLFGVRVALPTPEDLIVLKVLAGRDKDLVDAVGVARRHLARLDVKYIEETLQALCEIAEDTTAWRRFEEVLRKARQGSSGNAP